MRFGTIPQNPLEWAILSSGLVPTPLPDTYAVAWSRVIMAATQLKLFEAFGGMLVFGAAILATSLLPHWLGWATILYSLAGLAHLALTRDSLPIPHQLMPLVMGIVLLLA